MRLFLLFVAGLWACGALAQQNVSALFWRIVPPSGAEPSYLYGTVHSANDLAYNFVDHVLPRMDSVHTVAGELDPEALSGASLSLMSAMMLPAGMEVEDLYRRRKDKAFVREEMRRQLGPMAPMFTRMKPFYIMASMNEDNLPKHNAQLLDAHLLGEAGRRGRHVIGLETMLEQLQAINVLSLEKQAEMLLDHLRKDGHRDDMVRMLEAYAAQDMRTLREVGDASGGLPAELERSLIADRNRVMAHRIDSVIRADVTAMFLVGALHLIGPEGLVTLLADVGYTLQPIAMDGPPPVAPFPPAMLLAQGIRYVNDTLGFAIDMFGVPGITEGIMDGDCIGYREPSRERGVMVTRRSISEKERGLELPALLELDGVPGADAGTFQDVQGLQAYMVEHAEDEIQATVLALRHGEHLWLVLAAHPDATIGRQVIGSFRLTGLPD
jgi:uncharacterized protein YbaP (TraB family)